MLADGVIEKSNAFYYSHPVIVQKTEDKVRVCIDYRNLNDCIKPASWPLPCGSSGSNVPILPDSTTVHYPPYTTVCCIVVAIYSLHVEVNPSF